MNRSLLMLLRAETETLHSQLDSHPLLNVLLNNNLTKRQYAQSLQALYLPQKTLELSLVSAMSLFFPQHQYALRYSLIEQDLFQLNSPIADKPISDLGLSSPSIALGILYVLEGSKLGAKHILRSLADQPIPKRFFQSSIHDQGSGWKGFTGLTEHNNIEPNEVVSGAKIGFTCFIRSLEQSNLNCLQGMNYAQ